MRIRKIEVGSWFRIRKRIEEYEMLELVNNYYTMAGNNGADGWTIAAAIGTIASAVVATGAAGLALWMHISSEKKRDKEKIIRRIEQEISFLSGINAEFLGIKDGLNSIFGQVNKMKYKYNMNDDVISVHTNRDYFMYYENNSDCIGVLSNLILRNNLVEFYVTVKILFDCLEAQNEETKVFKKIREMADEDGNLTERERKMLRAALNSIEYIVPQIMGLRVKIEPMYNDIVRELKYEINKKLKELQDIDPTNKMLIDFIGS